MCDVVVERKNDRPSYPKLSAALWLILNGSPSHDPTVSYQLIGLLDLWHGPCTLKGCVTGHVHTCWEKALLGGAFFLPTAGHVHQGHLSSALVGHLKAIGPVSTSSPWEDDLSCFGEWAHFCNFSDSGHYKTLVSA
jgi:hypothetical protein